MAYFYGNQDPVDRGGKIVADVVCGLVLLAFSIAFFGPLGGILGFIILYGSLLGLDFIVPDENADPGTAVR